MMTPADRAVLLQGIETGLLTDEQRRRGRSYIIAASEPPPIVFDFVDVGTFGLGLSGQPLRIVTVGARKGWVAAWWSIATARQGRPPLAAAALFQGPSASRSAVQALARAADEADRLCGPLAQAIRQIKTRGGALVPGPVRHVQVRCSLLTPSA